MDYELYRDMIAKGLAFTEQHPADRMRYYPDTTKDLLTPVILAGKLGVDWTRFYYSQTEQDCLN